MDGRMRPLSGIRVLGLEQYVAGPTCSMILADAGAEVIKIEPPGTGEPRRALPPFAKNERGEKSSGGFMRFNRSKKSLTLDLKAEKGKEIFRALVKKSDVILENLRPGTMERLGFPYETIREINPAIIYASISGFGKWEPLRGPYWDRPGFDVVFHALEAFLEFHDSLAQASGNLGQALSEEEERNHHDDDQLKAAGGPKCNDLGCRHGNDLPSSMAAAGAAWFVFCRRPSPKTRSRFACLVASDRSESGQRQSRCHCVAFALARENRAFSAASTSV